MATRSILELIISSKKKGTAPKAVSSDLKKLGGLVQKLGIGMGTVAAGAAAAGVAMKKAFDLGREGAVIAQTTESFGLLLEKVGAAPDLLDDLSEAARGTVNDFDLMTSTATLLAGTSGELATALAASTPELLEIAKAANKLNPALGSTTFLYESLARGIKRSSPLILDNLGLVIKIGDANQKLADRLGKSVDQLTAEQKQLALLNDTMRAGQELIQQVGGDIDAQTDSYDRLTTSIENALNISKAEVSEGLKPLIDTLAEEVVFRGQLFEARSKELITLGENIRLLRLVKDGTLSQEQVLTILNTKIEANRSVLEASSLAMGGWKAGLVEAGEAAGAAADQVERTAVSLGRLTEAEIGREAVGALNEAFEEGRISPEDYETALIDVSTQLLGLSEEQVKGSLALQKLATDFRDSGTDSKGFTTEVKLLSVALNDIPDAIHTEIFVDLKGPGADAFGAGGFQHGGSFTVGGRPGADANLVAFRASRGERVTITPANQSETNVDQSKSLLQGANITINEPLDRAAFFEMMIEALGS